MEEAKSSKVTIRGFDPALWKEIRVEAIRRGVSGGELLNEIVSGWLKAQKEAKG